MFLKVNIFLPGIISFMIRDFLGLNALSNLFWLHRQASDVYGCNKEANIYLGISHVWTILADVHSLYFLQFCSSSDVHKSLAWIHSPTSSFMMNNELLERKVGEFDLCGGGLFSESVKDVFIFIFFFFLDRFQWTWRRRSPRKSY